MDLCYRCWSNQGLRQSQGHQLSAFVPLFSGTPFLSHCACRPQFRVLRRHWKPIYLIVLPILHNVLVTRLRFLPSTGIVTGRLRVWIMLNWMVSALELWLYWGDWRYRCNIIIIIIVIVLTSNFLPVSKHYRDTSRYASGSFCLAKRTDVGHISIRYYAYPLHFRFYAYTLCIEVITVRCTGDVTPTH